MYQFAEKRRAESLSNMISGAFVRNPEFIVFIVLKTGDKFGIFMIDVIRYAIYTTMRKKLNKSIE